MNGSTDEILSEGWSTCRLEQLVESTLGGDWGKAPSERPAGWRKVRVIRGADFRDWESRKGQDAAERVVKPTSLFKRTLKPGDIILEVSGGGPDQPVGRSVLVEIGPLRALGSPAICSNFCRQLRFRGEVDSAYVHLSLKHKYSRHEFDRFQNQTVNIRNLQVADFLAETVLPFPPLAEQKRIVAKVEELLKPLNAARERLARVPATLKRLRHAVLDSAFKGMLTADIRPVVDAEALPSDWRATTLGDLFSVQTGATPLKRRTDYFAGGRVPWIKTAQVQNGDIDHAEEFVTERALQETSLKLFPRGTILVAMYGEGRTRGQVARLRIPATTNQACAALRSTTLPPETFDFIFWFLRGRYEEMREEAVGGNQPNLSLGTIKRMAVSLPPLGEQVAIVRRVETLFNLSDAIEKRVAAATVRAESLTQAILAKAFRGELVPTEAELAQREGRAYEPAEVLLERIRAAGRGGRSSELLPTRPLSRTGRSGNPQPGRQNSRGRVRSDAGRRPPASPNAANSRPGR